jgi:hypothetical protein
VTKKKHRATEALRRLGGTPPEPDPNFRCHHKQWDYRHECKTKPVRMRECWWDGAKRWFCVEHDPVRIEHERKNRKKHIEAKRDRWKQMEHERKG